MNVFYKLNIIMDRNSDYFLYIIEISMNIKGYQLNRKSNGEPYTFYIVDDMTYMISSISDTIEQMGGKIIGSSTDSMTAYEQIKNMIDRIDVITCDLNMPYMDGLELLRKLKGYISNQKIVMISAHGMLDKIKEAKDLGVNQYLLKPFNPKDLFDILNKLCRG